MEQALDLEHSYRRVVPFHRSFSRRGSLDGEFHVGLPARQPDIADQYVFQGGASAFVRCGDGAALGIRFSGVEDNLPFSPGVGFGLMGLVLPCHFDLRSCFGFAPYRHLRFLLKHHVALQNAIEFGLGS